MTNKETKWINAKKIQPNTRRIVRVWIQDESGENVLGESAGSYIVSKDKQTGKKDKYWFIQDPKTLFYINLSLPRKNDKGDGYTFYQVTNWCDFVKKGKP